MGSLAGGKKKEGQCREMARDLSKFLYFSNPSELDFNHILKMKSVEAFIDELGRRAVGPSGTISKLNVLCFAQTFILHR